MRKFRYFLYTAVIIPVFIIAFWIFVIPVGLIKMSIEDSLSNNGQFATRAVVHGIAKGIFFTVTAESIELKKDNDTALIITDISSRINPLYLLKKKLAFSINGKIGTGDVNGFMRLPESGIVNIEQAEINAIPYLNSLGLKINGVVSAQLNFIENVLDVNFFTSRVELENSLAMIPLPLNAFHQIQGVLSVKDRIVNVESISLDADRGYARIKGEIVNGLMNLTLELMPSGEELKPMETMLISRYQVSPGYYVIPLKGPIM
jgi:type II secretion system protein N